MTARSLVFVQAAEFLNYLILTMIAVQKGSIILIPIIRHESEFYDYDPGQNAHCTKTEWKGVAHCFSC